MLKASSAVRTYHSYFLRGENRDQRNALGKPLESFVFNCNEDGDYRPFLLPMCTRNNGLIRGEVFLEVIPSVQHSSEYHGTSHSAASPFFFHPPTSSTVRIELPQVFRSLSQQRCVLGNQPTIFGTYPAVKTEAYHLAL